MTLQPFIATEVREFTSSKKVSNINAMHILFFNFFVLVYHELEP